MDSGWAQVLIPAAIILAAILIFVGIKRLGRASRSAAPAAPLSTNSTSPSAVKYAPRVLDNLVLPDTIRGLVGIRQWTWNGSILTSRNQKYIWTSGKMTADRIPDRNNNYGIYAYQLGSMIPPWHHHIGIVEMLEHIEVHSDGVLRAEKCKILAIIVNWGNSAWAREVSSQYHVPVYIANYPQTAFRRWILGPDGMKWLNHNFNLLQDGGKFDILQEAEKLLGGKS
jgi:hypothetical protein